MPAPTYKVFIDWDSDGGLSVGDFEFGLGSWNGQTFGTAKPLLTRSTVRSYHGNASLLVEWAGGALELAQFAAMGTFVVGKTYTFKARVYVPSTGGRHVSAALASIGFGTTSSVTDTWTEVSITFTATSTTHLLQLWTATTPSAGDKTWIDYAQVYMAGEEITAMTPGVVSEVNIQYGRDQARSLAPMGSGEVSFSVDNVSRDLSPENAASPLANVLGPGRDLLVEAHYNNRCYVLFFGSVDDFKVDASQGKWLASFTGIDAMARFKGRPVSTRLHPALRTGEAVHKVLDAIGWTGGRDIDAGASTLRWWWAESDDASEVLQEILAVEGPNALLTVGSSGEIVFRDRHHRLLRTASTTSQATFQDAVVKTYALLVASDSPMAWWRLSETSGTSAADAAGSFTGTYNGSPTLGVPGLLVDETSTSVSFVNSTVKSVTVPGTNLNPASVTVEVVCQPTSWNGNNRIVQKGNSDQQWRLLAEGGVLKWDVFGKATVTTALPSAGVTHHIVGTYNSATGYAAMYVDGELATSTTGTSGSAPSSTDSLAIAQKPGSGVTSDGFNGLIDEVAIYSTVLTPTTVRAHAGEALRYVVEHDPPFLVNSGWRDMINHVEIPVTVREPEPVPEEVWRTDEAFTVAAGQSVQFVIATDEPFYNLQPATQDTPDSLVAEDPDLLLTAWRPDVIRTGGPVTVVYSRTSGQTTTVTITASSLARVSSVRLRAHTVTTSNSSQKVTREDPASVTAMRGVRPYAPSIPWVGSHDANAIADLILGQRSSRLPTVTFDVTNGTANQLVQILTRDISDRITVIDSESGVSGDFYIESIAHTITDDGNTHRVTFACEKVRPTPSGLFMFDVSGAGFNDGRFGPSGLDSPSSLFVFDQAGRGFNDGQFAN